MPEISQEELDAFKAQKDAIDNLTTKFDSQSESLKRIEGENAKSKTRATEAEQKLTDLEKEKVENDGDIQKRLDMEIAENAKLKKDVEIKSEKAMTSKLKSEIAGEFPNLNKGAVDFMLTIKSHEKLLKIDKEAETVDGIKEFGEACLKDYPYLQGKKTIKTGDNLPPENPDLNDDDLTEDQKYGKELSAAKTQVEYDAVRKKWKRD